MKRLLLFILLICALSIIASAAPFSDVQEDDWFYKDVKSAYELDLINGKGSADTFKPEDNMTYAEAMEVVDTMHITHVHDAPEDADAFFPVIDPAIWREDSRSDMQVDPATGITYDFVVYRRR